MHTTPIWTETTCPPAIRTLPNDLRGAALEFANEELLAGRHPDRALSFGIARAFSLDEEELGRDAARFIVQCEGEQWILCSDVSDERYAFDDYEEALRRGSELARARGLPLFVFGAEGGLIGSYELEDRETHEDHCEPIHLVADESGWVLRGADEAQVFDSKKEGLLAARALAKERGADLVIHYLDGAVVEEKKPEVGGKPEGAPELNAAV